VNVGTGPGVGRRYGMRRRKRKYIGRIMEYGPTNTRFPRSY
jgi:hypothetical protein